MCEFGKSLVPGSSPPETTEHIYYGPLSVQSINNNGAPGIDVNQLLNVVNPAYITVVNTVRRMSATPIDGVGGEQLLQAQLCSGALKAIMTGLLDPRPDGFIPTTWVGAIPTVMSKVADGLQALISEASILGSIGIGNVGMARVCDHVSLSRSRSVTGLFIVLPSGQVPVGASAGLRRLQRTDDGHHQWVHRVVGEWRRCACACV
jgi:hypothetical protein